jgi:hypothetical protein
MRRINCLRIATSVVLAGSIAGCQSESRNIPLLTILGLPFDRRDQSLSAPIGEAGVRSPPERQS